MAVINAASYSVHGTLPGGEVWACTVYAALGTAINTQTDAQTNVDAVKANTGFTTLVTQLKAQLNTGSAVTGLTARFYDTLPGPSKYTSEATVTGAAGTGTGAHQNQAAIVASLRTAAGGKSGRGRLYLPATALSVSATGQTAQSNVDSIALAVKGFLDAIDAGGSGSTASVYSPKLGTMGRITVIRVDSRLDVMRRRAAKQAALFTGQQSR